MPVKGPKKSFVRRKRTKIILKDIDPLKIEDVYQIGIESNIGQNTHASKEFQTQLQSIIPEDSKKGTITYIDDSTKAEHTLVYTMKDINTGRDPRDNRRKKCFYDRHSIPENLVKLYCPVKHVPHMLFQTSKSSFGISVTHSYELTPLQFKEHVEKHTPVVEPGVDCESSRYIVKGDYYLTDGVFCSFSCMRSFIRDNSDNPLYKESENLMNEQHYAMTGCDSVIPYAHHWRLLEDHMGHMTIEKYRESVGKVEYDQTFDYKINAVPIGVVFSENYVF